VVEQKTLARCCKERQGGKGAREGIEEEDERQIERKIFSWEKEKKEKEREGE